jgi:hypothetical protein
MTIMRRIGSLVLVVTMLIAGGYALVYFARWEWNRALVSGVVFVAAEVAVATGAVLRRLSRVEARLGEEPPDGDPTETSGDDRPEAEEFRWLALEPDRFGVFIPILMGGGILVSAITWVLERISQRTSDPASARELPDSLRRISFPDGGLLPQDHELRAQGPAGHDDELLRLLLGPISERGKDGR